MTLSQFLQKLLSIKLYVQGLGGSQDKDLLRIKLTLLHIQYLKLVLFCPLFLKVMNLQLWLRTIFSLGFLFGALMFIFNAVKSWNTAPVVTSGGEQLHVYGLRTIYFTFKTDENKRIELGITFTICDVTEAILSFSKLLSTGLCSCTLQPQRRYLQVGDARIPIAHEGRHFYIYPENLKYTEKIDVLLVFIYFLE